MWCVFGEISRTGEDQMEYTMKSRNSIWMRLKGRSTCCFCLSKGSIDVTCFIQISGSQPNESFQFCHPRKRGIGSAEFSLVLARKPLELHHLFHLKHVKWSILVMFDYVLIKETLKCKRKYPNDLTMNLLSQEIPSSYSTHIVCKWEPPHRRYRHPILTSRFFLRWDFPQHPWKNPWYMNFSLDFWTYGCKWLNGHREIHMWLLVFYSIFN